MKNIWRSVLLVYSRPDYILRGLVLVFLFLSLVVILPNRELILAMFSGDLSLGGKISFLLNLYLALPFMYGTFQAIFIIIIAFIFGLNSGMLIYYLANNKNVLVGKSIFSQISAIFLALVGLGCAGCGALLLTPLLGTAFAGVLLTLPYDGLELSVLALAIMLLSLYKLSKKIDNPYQT